MTIDMKTSSISNLLTQPTVKDKPFLKPDISVGCSSTFSRGFLTASRVENGKIFREDHISNNPHLNSTSRTEEMRMPDRQTGPHNPLIVSFVKLPLNARRMQRIDSKCT